MSGRAVDRSQPLAVTYRTLATAQKSSVGVSAYSRWINRPSGRVLAVLAHRVGLSPNQVTAVSGLTTLSGLLVLATQPPSVLTAAAVTALLALGYAWDSADGQVARLRGGGSAAGEWLDHVFDAIKMVSIHVVVAVHWFRFLDVTPAVLLVPLGFAIIASSWFFSQILTEMLARVDGSYSAPRHRPLRQTVLSMPADYGVLCLSFLLIAVPEVWVFFYSALGAVNLLLLLRQLRVWFKRVSSL